MDRLSKGFTLMEMLIVIAIIAILIAIAIPNLSYQLKLARNATDLANMRSAYSLAAIQWMSGNRSEVYYYNGGGITTTPDNIAPYGKSTEDASEFSQNLPVPAYGIPANNFISVHMKENGEVDFISWGNVGYYGMTVSSVAAHRALTNAEDLDLLLLDSLEESAQKLTYGEIKALAQKYNLKIDNIYGHSAIQLAWSSVDEESGQVVPEKK